MSPAAALDLASGAGFALSAVGYRAATLALDEPVPWVAGIYALVWAQSIQSVLLGGYLAVRDPSGLLRVMAQWRVSTLAGLMGALASMGWLTAFALRSAVELHNATHARPEARKVQQNPDKENPILVPQTMVPNGRRISWQSFLSASVGTLQQAQHFWTSSNARRACIAPSSSSVESWKIGSCCGPWWSTVSNFSRIIPMAAWTIGSACRERHSSARASIPSGYRSRQ
jgi:hypothetical protein